MAPIVVALIYKRLPNGKGTLRGLENGSKFQFHEHVKRQPLQVQMIYLLINRLRAACVGAMLGGFLAFVGLSFFSVYSAVLGWFVFSIALPLWWLFNGMGTIVVRGGNFPKELLVGKREFVVGAKATFAGLSRIAIGVLFMVVPLNALYLIYLFVTGQFGDLVMKALRLI